jgi:15-cis-phytoene synthase
MGMRMRTRGMAPELHGSYDACRRLHRRHDPTFYYATRRLTPEVRPAVHAVYAFVRRADELVDGPRRAADAGSRRDSLDALERDLWMGLETGSSDDPAIAALADAGARHRLPLGELSTYMDSMRVDCDRVRIDSRDELELYMNGSAAAVGRILAPLMGAAPAASDSFATLGRAFQLTNFIRDVREDFSLDRIYLPRQERERFGVGEEQFERREATAGFRALVALEVDRARGLFERGSAALDAVDPRLRPGMRMARGVYLGVLDRVERLGYDVLGRRASLPPWEMGRAAVGSLRG